MVRRRKRQNSLTLVERVRSNSKWTLTNCFVFQKWKVVSRNRTTSIRRATLSNVFTNVITATKTASLLGPTNFANSFRLTSFYNLLRRFGSLREKRIRSLFVEFQGQKLMINIQKCTTNFLVQTFRQRKSIHCAGFEQKYFNNMAHCYSHEKDFCDVFRDNRAIFMKQATAVMMKKPRLVKTKREKSIGFKSNEQSLDGNTRTMFLLFPCLFCPCSKREENVLFYDDDRISSHVELND